MRIPLVPLAGESDLGATSRGMFSTAEAYEQFMGRWSRLLAPALIDFVGVHAGDSVLDVGSGTGVLSLAIATAVETASVTGIDPAQAYVSFAARASSPRVRFEVGDAHQLPFTAASFDTTMSLLVLNFVPEPGRAVAEMTRVTKRGGVVGAAVWDYGAGMEMLRAFWDEAVALDPAIEPRDEAHMPLCRRGELVALWCSQGLTAVDESSLSVPLGFASFEDYWTPFLLGQGPAGAYAANLPAERQRALEQRLRERLIGTGPDRAFELNARAWAVKGRVP